MQNLVLAINNGVSLYSINKLIFVKETQCVIFEIEKKFLSVMYVNFMLQELKFNVNIPCFICLLNFLGVLFF